MNQELLTQYTGLRESCGLWHNHARALLVLTGEDRVRLLNGLVTCEVKDLAPGRGVRGFFVDVRGHILADVVIRSQDDSLWLELPATATSLIATHIGKYIIADRVEVEPASDREALSLVGPHSSTVMKSVFGACGVWTEPWNHVLTEFRGNRILVADEGGFGVPAITVWSSATAICEIQRQLLASLAEIGSGEVGVEAIEIVRVEEGIPRFGIDYGSDNLPQETGIEGMVSYSKGCYLGQEVVARLHYRGQAARSLSRLECRVEEMPSVGSQVNLGERSAGVVTSVVAAPGGQRVSALAMLQRRASEKGTELQLESGGVARVV